MLTENVATTRTAMGEEDVLHGLSERSGTDCREVVARPPEGYPACNDTPASGLLGDGRLTHGLAAVIGTIGHANFAATVADLLTAAAQVEQFSVISLGKAEDTRCLFSWHRLRPERSAYLVGRYIEGRFFEQDPALRALRQDGQARCGTAFLRREQIEDDWYRHFFYDDPELSGKLSVLDQDDARGIYQNFYTPRSYVLSSREADNLINLSQILSQCVIRHRELTSSSIAVSSAPPREAIERLLACRAPGLTTRELQVCSRIVAGYTTEAIALDLGIAANSVATYRKRAYRKLRICSHHQLFSLCLEAARQ